MREYEQALETLERDLKGLPSALPRQYREALSELRHHFSEDQLDEWARAGLGLAGQSVRSWEAAGEYMRASAQIVGMVSHEGFRHWTELGVELAGIAIGLAKSYFRAGPALAGHVGFEMVREWVDLGKQLYKGTWKSGALASEFLDRGPELLPLLSRGELRALVRFVDSLAGRSHELAIASLQALPGALHLIEPEDRGPFLDFASVIVETSWADARPFAEHGPGLLNSIEPGQRTRFLDLATTMARSRARVEAFRHFSDAARALGEVDREDHGLLIEMAEDLARVSPVASMSFLKSTPAVLIRIAFADLEGWRSFGKQILESSLEGGEAYFRLESGKGEELLEKLSARVELSRVSDVLRMYCKALCGAEIAVQAATHLTEKKMGWVSERPTTEGSAIFLPEMVELFPEKTQNFGVLKVYATHQVGHLEFNSFGFSFERDGALLGNTRRERLRKAGTAEQVTDMERFFDLFEDRKLALDLFTIVEDARIDQAIAREYAGIRRTYGAIQERELEQRPPAEAMPLQTAYVENMVRASLGGWDRVVWPANLADRMAEGLALVQTVQQPDATVEDTAEAVLRIYDIIYSIPNSTSDDLGSLGDWGGVGQEQIENAKESAQSRPLQEGVEGTVGDVPEDQKQPYLGPPEVGFRGDFKPELVQLLMKLKGMGEQRDGQTQTTGLSPEQLKELLEKNVEFEIGTMDEGDLENSSGMFVTNLLNEADQQRKRAQEQKQRKRQQKPKGEGDEEEDSSPLEQQPQFFYYDEWDFRANDYKPAWCCVQETVLREGDEQFFEKTLQEHAALVSQTRRQFELLKPEMFRKIKKLPDGEDFDLDLLVDFIVERRVGMSPVPRLYTRRNKIERDVAVSFLLDMSASTDEEINRRERKGDDEWEDDAKIYLQKLAERRAAERMNPPKRIIDIEKESTVVLIKALEAIGDTYGIYGFSGYGRDAVEFYVIKDLDETFGETVKKRIDRIVPIRSTRMGAAIRHATAKLDLHQAKVKVLFLVSDGRPQDHGYGRDRTEKDYAIHDTKMALAEARQKGITPFCLTVDRNGHDYLKTMCEDMAYEVVADIEMLPSRIPTLYRMLTR